MKRKLFKQVCSEWRTNIWLALELFVVSVVMWYIVDYFYVKLSVFSQPRGFDTEHCYRLSFNNVTDKNPAYIPDRSEQEQSDDIREILSRLSHLPFVEAASLSINSHPYNTSNSGISVYRDSLNTEGYVVRRVVTPDFVKVFRYEGIDGESPEELAEILSRGEWLVSGLRFNRKDIDQKDLVGTEFFIAGDTLNAYRVGGAVRLVRYDDFNEWGSSVIASPQEDWYAYASECCIRVRPEEDKDVQRRLMDMSESLFHVGNNLLVNVTSFEEVKRRFQQGSYNTFRDMSFMLGFLLLNIFLGLFGTFWFRTQQKASEIAIRKSLGATRGDIFRRLLGEGLLLLLIVTPLALGTDCLLAIHEFNSYYDGGFLSLTRLLATSGISAALITLMIVAGVLFPAYSAMRLDPAETLKDE